MNPIKSCPACGWTMIWIDMFYSEDIGYWYCVHCYYTIPVPISYQIVEKGDTKEKTNGKP